MGLQLNSADARKADTFSNIIKESGRYVGTITRAEKLKSKNNVEGVGLSFKSDDGASASYLDVYTVKPDGSQLRGYSIIQALLCCLKLKSADDGTIKFEKWDNDLRKPVQTSAPGYPAMMGKRIGVWLQKELQTNQNTGEDVERVNLLAVFEASTGLMASEILDGKTKPEKGESVDKMLAANPVRDTRKRGAAKPATAASAAPHDFNDDVPF